MQALRNPTCTVNYSGVKVVLNTLGRKKKSSEMLFVNMFFCDHGVFFSNSLTVTDIKIFSWTHSPILQLSELQAELLALSERHRRSSARLERVNEELRHDAYTNELFWLSQIFISEAKSQKSNAGSTDQKSGCLPLGQRAHDQRFQVHFAAQQTFCTTTELSLKAQEEALHACDVQGPSFTDATLPITERSNSHTKCATKVLGSVVNRSKHKLW